MKKLSTFKTISFIGIKDVKEIVLILYLSNLIHYENQNNHSSKRKKNTQHKECTYIFILLLPLTDTFNSSPAQATINNHTNYAVIGRKQEIGAQNTCTDGMCKIHRAQKTNKSKRYLPDKSCDTLALHCSYAHNARENSFKVNHNRRWFISYISDILILIMD